MKLAYMDTPASGPGPPTVVLHREGMAPTGELTEVVLASGAAGRVVAPVGDYAYTASGMEVAGGCWYRVLPGFAGTDPISLTKAVVQVGDLLDDLALEDPALIGWGQGAVVALGAGLLRPGTVGSVVCVDAPLAHLGHLPAAALAQDAYPRLLVAATVVGDGPTTGELRACLGHHRIEATTWRWPGGSDQGGDRGDGDKGDGDKERDDALAQRIGSWLEDG
jgi:pimeloyl-ACP methyl ester carboxylesterase